MHPSVIARVVQDVAVHAGHKGAFTGDMSAGFRLCYCCGHLVAMNECAYVLDTLRTPLCT